MGYPNFGKTIADYTVTIRQINIRKGFRPAEGGPGANSFGDYIALAHSELSEALEAYRDHRLADATVDTWSGGTKTLPGKPKGVGSEFADLFIRLVDMADVFGIDLEREVDRKIAYNATRPFQHGGRTLADALQPPVSRKFDHAPGAATMLAGISCDDPKHCPPRVTVVSTLDRLMQAMPNDPRDWWTGDEVDAFFDEWSRVGMPGAKLADAAGGDLTIWTDLVAASGKLRMEIKDTGYGPHIELVSGAYTVGIVPAEK